MLCSDCSVPVDENVFAVSPQSQLSQALDTRTQEAQAPEILNNVLLSSPAAVSDLDSGLLHAAGR